MSDPSALSPEEQYERAKAASEPKPPTSGGENPFLGLPGYQPPAPPALPGKPYTFQMLPLSKDPSGNVEFNPNAGLLGELKKPFDLTYGVRTGAIPADVRNPAYTGGALGAALSYGPGAAVSRAGVGGVIKPKSEALDTAAETGFRDYRQSGQMYPGDEYRSLLQNTQDQLRQAGFHSVSESAPVPHAILDAELKRIQKAPFVTSQDLDALRTQFRGQGLRGQNVPANMQAREALFGYIEQNLPPGSGRSISDAVGNYRQARHSDVLTSKDKATSRLNEARAQGPELSAEQTRTNIAKLLNSKTALKGFSETERNILENARATTPAINRAQYWGNQLTPAKALAAAGLAGGAVGGPALIAGAGASPAVIPALAAGAAALTGGAALRSHANRGARRMASEADEAIRGLAPLAREQFATAPSNFRATAGPYRVTANPMLAAALAARQREKQPQPQNLPQQYRVLPDGTIEEFL